MWLKKESVLFLIAFRHCSPNSMTKRHYNIASRAAQSNSVYLSVIKLTNRFQVAVRLFSNRSQMTSKCDKNKKVAHEAQAQPSMSLMFLPHFDVLCDLLVNKRTATWNLFVLYIKKLKYTEKKVFMMTSSIRLRINQNACITELFI